MFKEIFAARIKLTFFYVFIVMCISLFFSLAVYAILDNELKREFRSQVLKGIPNSYRQIFTKQLLEQEQEIFREARKRIFEQLIVVNFFILTTTSVAGYFLSGQTLKPVEKSIEEQKRFISDASHELRTPLTVLKTEIEVALRNKKLSSLNLRKILKSNLEEVNRMQTLSNSLLMLSRYQSNKKLLNKEKINLAQVATLAISKFNKKFKKYKIKSELKDAYVQGDETSIIELIGILIDNAIKYSNDKNTIIVRTYINKNNKVIEVQDFGIGIKDSDIPYIFNRFYRADTSRNKKYIDGYGLGLSIAKSIAEAHKAKILVDSLPNKGSTFKVVFS